MVFDGLMIYFYYVYIFKILIYLGCIHHKKYPSFEERITFFASVELVTEKGIQYLPTYAI